MKSSHVQSGSLCTWESVNKKMTIYGNRGIVRKTRNRIAESPLSHVQITSATGLGKIRPV